ncbi:putative pth11-like integral membrane protein [Phaeomoniella chlamydospora]|uniref:Putative pth11-like integral membrane protein n=1 Tax=Phaeomoniella chlamydospora TaxID=158046 RepID=A0A0G2EBZ7_PHACM|nr:putative pth11-like integral membrane protein [Phaeomoniella chlamydospora]
MTTAYDSESKGAQVLSTSIIFTAFAAGAVILRLFTRSYIAYSLGPEDYLIATALVLSIALTVLISEEVRYGTGRHLSSLAPNEYPHALKPLYASVPIYNASLSITKCSLLLQYLRLFPSQKVRRTCWIVLGIVIAYGIYAVFVVLFMCTPVKYFWDKSIKGTCLNNSAVYFSTASFNIISDIVIICIPIPVVKSLQLPKRQKIGLGLIFGVGLFACVTSILRLHSLYVFSVATDTTWTNAAVATWSSVETNTNIICACLPTLKPLFVRFVPRLLGSTRSRTHGYNYHASGAAGVSGHKDWLSRSKSGALFSTATTAAGGIPLSPRECPDHLKSDLEYGVNTSAGGKHDSYQGDDGHGITVTQVFKVEHEGSSTRVSGSTATSEIDLVIDKN